MAYKKQECGETMKVSGTKNLTSGVSPSKVGKLSPAVSPQAKRSPSKKVHTK